MRRILLVAMLALMMAATLVWAGLAFAVPGGNGEGATVNHATFPEEGQVSHTVFTPSGNTTASAHDNHEGNAIANDNHKGGQVSTAVAPSECNAHVNRTPSGKENTVGRPTHEPCDV